MPKAGWSYRGLMMAGAVPGWGGGRLGEREIGSGSLGEGSGGKLEASASSCRLRGDDMRWLKVDAFSVSLIHTKCLTYSGGVHPDGPTQSEQGKKAGLCHGFRNAALNTPRGDSLDLSRSQAGLSADLIRRDPGVPI
jgi:hypothetical protein